MMHHVITIGDILRALGELAGVGGFLLGIWLLTGYFTSAPPRTNGSDLVAGCGWFSAICGLALFTLLLSACATPPVETKTVTVSVPVAIQPIKPSDVPTPPAPLGPRPATLPQAADALLSKVCELESYVIKAVPLLSVSAGLPPAQAPDYPECDKKR